MRLKTKSLLILIGVLGTPWLAQAQLTDYADEHHLFGATSQETSSLSLSGGYAVLSNALSNGTVKNLRTNDAISAASDTRLVDRNPDGKAFLEAGYGFDLTYKFQGNWSWYVLAGMQEEVIAKSRMGLAQLMVLGNADLEDQTVKANDTYGYYLSTQTFGFGMEKSSERVRFATALELVKASRFQEYSLDGFSLYTAPYGEYIDASLDMTTRAAATGQGKAGAWYGTGVRWSGAVDLTISESGGRLFARWNDVGFIQFAGVSKTNYQYADRYQGIEITNLLTNGTPSLESGQLDSLENLAHTRTSRSAKTFWYPSVIQLGMTMPLGEKLDWAATVGQRINFGRPHLRTGLTWHAAPALHIEPYVYVGGLSAIDYGVRVGSVLGESVMVSLNYQLLEAQLTSKQSNSQALFASIRVLL